MSDPMTEHERAQIRLSCANMAMNGRLVGDPDSTLAFAKRLSDFVLDVTSLPADVARGAPAVPIEESLTDDVITCLECGQTGKSLKRHLKSAHRLTPEAYRQRWGLQDDYPMAAPNYSARRSELAKQTGLGRRSRARAA